MRCYNCRGSGRWCVGKCWARLWRRIRTNIQTRRKEVESKRWAWPLTVEAPLGFERVKDFISIATRGFMTTWSILSTLLQLCSCFCVVKVVLAVGVVCYVLVDVKSYIALFIMWKGGLSNAYGVQLHKNRRVFLTSERQKIVLKVTFKIYDREWQF